MSIIQRRGDDHFEMYCEPIEVTSLHRPDTAWVMTDAKGHEHRWFTNGKPADGYTASAKYDVPTLVEVFDEWGYYEDGERCAIRHFECRECHECVEPHYTADTNRQFIAGLRRCAINGVPVSVEEFQRRWEEAQ